MTKTDRFVLLKLAGLGTCKAARAAGFEAGVPGGHALAVYERTEEVASNCDDAAAELEQIRQKLEGTKKRAQELRHRRQALKLLTRYEQKSWS